MKTISAVVYIKEEEPDSNGLSLNIDNFQLPESIPVRFNYKGEPIGVANLTRKGDIVVANIHLIDTVSGKFYPCVGGMIDGGFYSEGAKIITKVWVKELSLCINPNVDTRIGQVTIE